MANHKKHEAVIYKDSATWQGRQFGMLTAQKLSRPRRITETGLYTYYVECRCECGVVVDRSPIKLERGEATGCPNCVSTRLLTPAAEKRLLLYFPHVQKFVRRRYWRAHDLDELESAAIATLIDVCREKSEMPIKRFKKHLISRVRTTCNRTMGRWHGYLSVEYQDEDGQGLAIADPVNFIQAIEDIDFVESLGASELTARQMMVIKGFFYEQKTCKEIGLEIGRSKSGTRLILDQAIWALQKLVEKRFGTEVMVA